MFTGAITAITTPFRNGSLDEAKLKEQVEFQIAQGINGLVPVGTTGESPTLDFDEHFKVIEITVKVSNGRVPVIAGVGGNSTAEALKLHEFAHKIGATAGLSVNPYYNKPSQEGLYRHFMTLAEKIPLPIVLYNIPGRCGINMTPATVARLFNAAPKSFVAIKEAAGSCDQVTEIKQACGITILSGDDSLTLPFMSVGAAGVISVLSNIAPAPVAKMVALARAGNWTDAQAIHHKFYNLTKSLFLDGNPAGVKAAMQMLGRDTGEMRLPVVEASEATKKTIEANLRTVGLL
ncbi:MAG: 4-hydroxy-tetrahydrodipicolinate synthase [Tepidisphaeraceae bacterium]